jgi:hypothetical protein
MGECLNTAINNYPDLLVMVVGEGKTNQGSMVVKPMGLLQAVSVYTAYE